MLRKGVPSFATHPKAIYWDYEKNTLRPEEVALNSNKNFYFICGSCNHSFSSALNNVVKGRWCPYCAVPNQKLCGDQDCNSCFKRSFASSPKSEYWDYDNNDKIPLEVALNAKLKHYFICNVCSNSFKSSPKEVNRGIWCPICKHKTEKKIYNDFTIYTLKTQAKFDWCRGEESDRLLPFDFLIEEHKIIIECDGAQHFRQVRDWKSPEEQQDNDKRKMRLANENGYSVIRILQEDVWNDSIDWINELKVNIEYLIETKEVKNIFIGGEIYNSHRPTVIINGVEYIDDLD